MATETSAAKMQPLHRARGKARVDGLSTRFEQITFKSSPSMKKIDLSKHLESGRKKLESIDSQRILTVLDETLRKVEVLTLLPYVSENIEQLSFTLGKDLVQVIKGYDILQDEYTKALSQERKTSFRRNSRRQSDTIGSDSTSSEALMSNASLEDDYEIDGSYEHVIAVDSSRNIEALHHHLQQCLKDILRLLRSNPVGFKSIKEDRTERAHEANVFIETLKTFRELLMIKISTNADEENQKHKKIEILLNKQRKSETLIAKLEEELRTHEDSKEKEIGQKNDQIRALKSAIDRVEQDATAFNERVMTEAMKNETGELKTFDGKKLKIQQVLLQMKQNLQKSISEHRENELALRKRKFKIETEVENWLVKYDADMSERQDEIDELQTIHKDEQQQLEELQKHFDELEKDYLQVLEERRIAKEKREEAERMLQRTVKAATVIQSMWRSYKCRKALKSKNKKGKKSKGKGKKGRK